MEPIPRRAAREPEAFFDSKLRSEWTVLDPNEACAQHCGDSVLVRARRAVCACVDVCR